MVHESTQGMKSSVKQWTGPLFYMSAKTLEIAYPKHLILLVVSKYLDEHLLQIDLLVLSN